jgi:hypothetical protein
MRTTWTARTISYTSTGTSDAVATMVKQRAHGLRCLPCDGEVPGRAHGPVEEVGRQRQMDGQRGACHEIDGIGLSRREKDHADDREARAFEGFERNDPRQERCGLLQTTSAGLGQ